MSCFNFLTGLCISAASARAGAAWVSTPHFFTGELRIRTAYTKLCDDIELDILEARVKESCMENGVVAGGYLNKGCARFLRSEPIVSRDISRILKLPPLTH
jgi:hypothetical protein